jgi:hypothetical protein
MSKTICLLSFALAAALIAPCTQAAEWGNLMARFVFDGAPPPEKPAQITSDKEFCGKHKVLLEALVVDPDNKGVANVVVYLYLGRTDAKPSIHESYAATEKAEVKLDNNKCRFDPHVCLLRTTQTLLLGNSDPVAHNTKIDTFKNAPINPILPAGGELRHKFPLSERLPARVSCSIHPWMSGWLLVKDHPYFAVSDKEGKFEIRNLPVGKWTFQFWHETSGYVSEVKLGGEPTAWARGRAEIDVKAGDNDLGEVLLSPALFKK